MKKHFLVIMIIIMLVGCESSNSDKDNPSYNFIGDIEGEPIDILPIGYDEIVEIVNNQPNLKASEDLKINVPEKAVVGDFVSGYALRQSNEDFYNDFLDMFEYLFPNHDLNEDWFYYYGKNSYVEYDEEGNLIRDVNKVKDKYNDIISGKEDVIYFLYNENPPGVASEWGDFVCAVFTSPIGNDLSRFNKGKAVYLYGKLSDTGKYPSLEGFDPIYSFDYIGTYPPDSTESFKLLDKEMPINEAVRFYEEYINNLPYPKEPTGDMCVAEVAVLKVSDDVYGYYFYTAREYKGILCDWTSISSYQKSAENDFIPDFLIGKGFMLESDDVDFTYGIYRSDGIIAGSALTEIIPFQTAIEKISESLSDLIEFEVRKIEFLYCREELELTGDGTKVQDYSYKTTAVWKCTLFNPNDGLMYVTYLDAKDGENFRYYNQRN